LLINLGDPALCRVIFLPAPLRRAGRGERTGRHRQTRPKNQRINQLKLAKTKLVPWTLQKIRRRQFPMEALKVQGYEHLSTAKL